MFGAMRATEHHPAGRFHAVANDAAAAMGARRRQSVNRALKAVKRMRLAAHNHLKRFIVLITAHLADTHCSFLL
jgi:hypothetical protein